MTTSAVLQVQDLYKYFKYSGEGIFRRRDGFVHAVDGVSFDLGQGEVLGLVGESGCGKSTLALTLMGLEKASDGQILFKGQDITHLKGKVLKEMRRQIQMVFQDPYESLNPLMTIGEVVAEPLKVHGLLPDKQERAARVTRALEDAGLKPAGIYLERYPHELSGGQRQRVVIAGALVLEPTILLADEPVSMLDVSVRAGILNLLRRFAREMDVGVLYISHDLGTIRYISDRTAIMYLGRIVEIGQTEKVITNPLHPYTRALIDSVPEVNPKLKRPEVDLLGRFIEEERTESGCRFHPRCTRKMERCSGSEPELIEAEEGHEVACFFDR